MILLGNLALIYEVQNNSEAYALYVTLETEGNPDQWKFATKWKAAIAEGDFLSFKEVEGLYQNGLKHIDYWMPNFLQVGNDKPVNQLQQR